MEDIESSNTHNNVICLSCHGPNDLIVGLCFKGIFSHHRAIRTD